MRTSRFFENLKQEQKTLEGLYRPVGGNLGSESAQEQDLEFSIRWEADLDKWLERGSGLFDQRKTLPYGTMHDLRAAACRILAPAWTSGVPAQIGPALESFIAEFRKPEHKPRNYLRSGATALDVLQWLYELDHLRLTYGLKKCPRRGARKAISRYERDCASDSLSRYGHSRPAL